MQGDHWPDSTFPRGQCAADPGVVGENPEFMVHANLSDKLWLGLFQCLPSLLTDKSHPEQHFFLVEFEGHFDLLFMCLFGRAMELSSSM